MTPPRSQDSVRAELDGVLGLDARLSVLHGRIAPAPSSAAPDPAHLQALAERALARLDATEAPVSRQPARAPSTGLYFRQAQDRQGELSKPEPPRAAEPIQHSARLHTLGHPSTLTPVWRQRRTWWATAAAVLVLLLAGLAVLRPGAGSGGETPFVTLPGAGRDAQVLAQAEDFSPTNGNPSPVDESPSGAAPETSPAPLTPRPRPAQSVPSARDATASPSEVASAGPRVIAAWTPETLDALAAIFVAAAETSPEAEWGTEEYGDIDGAGDNDLLGLRSGYGDRAVLEWALDEEAVATLYGETGAPNDW